MSVPPSSDRRIVWQRLLPATVRARAQALDALLTAATVRLRTAPPRLADLSFAAATVLDARPEAQGRRLLPRPQAGSVMPQPEPRR